MTILTPIATPPSTTDPADFAARGDAFVAAIQTMVNEINAAGGVTGIDRHYNASAWGVYNALGFRRNVKRSRRSQ